MRPFSKKMKSQIQLTDFEQELFASLKEVASECELNTTMRVAGGWVRDKMLGLNSDDIDIALDDMYGSEFSRLLVQKGKANKFDVIKANSEKSKHLETATLRIKGVPIDFVNLRAERYTEVSRVPDIQAGTAMEDAYRRDLTINALFYNINEDKIEDFTGRGISDLETRTIRTPLDPLQTFLDDPLRVIRAIRFANRFEFCPTPELLNAAKHASVRVSFHFCIILF